MTRRFTSTGLAVLLLSLSFVAPAGAAERPTMNHTCDPRPDILAHPLYYAHTEYRRAYNRPRNLSGWIAYSISRTSQEAMVWEENRLAGSYDGKDCPPRYKRYFGPKPWEILQTGARPDFATPQSSMNQPAPISQQSLDTLRNLDEASAEVDSAAKEDANAIELDSDSSSRVPPPVAEQTSPSDLL